MKELERMRWRCRRGMLELDIVLGRFVEKHYPALDAAQRAAFDALLDMPDVALWDMITGNRLQQQDGSQHQVLGLLRLA
jgi:antitoxin CptB